MKYIILLLALTLAGCQSFDTAQLQGLNVASFQWSETYPAVGLSIACFGVHTNTASHVTTIDSLTIQGHNPFGGGGGSITGLQFGGEFPAPVLTVSGIAKSTTKTAP